MIELFTIFLLNSNVDLWVLFISVIFKCECNLSFFFSKLLSLSLGLMSYTLKIPVSWPNLLKSSSKNIHKLPLTSQVLGWHSHRTWLSPGGLMFGSARGG